MIGQVGSDPHAPPPALTIGPGIETRCGSSAFTKAHMSATTDRVHKTTGTEPVAACLHGFAHPNTVEFNFFDLVEMLS